MSLFDNETEEKPRRGGDRRRQEGQMARHLALALAIVSLITTVFVAGYSWRQVSDGAVVLAKIPETYQTKEVAELQYRTVVEQLVEVRKQMERLQVSVDAMRDRRKE